MFLLLARTIFLESRQTMTYIVVGNHVLGNGYALVMIRLHSSLNVMPLSMLCLE